MVQDDSPTISTTLSRPSQIPKESFVSCFLNMAISHEVGQTDILKIMKWGAGVSKMFAANAQGPEFSLCTHVKSFMSRYTLVIHCQEGGDGVGVPGAGWPTSLA